VLACLNHLSKDLVLLVCRLDSVKQDAAVKHAKIRPKIFGQRVVPVFEFSVWSSGCHLARAGLCFVNRAVELVFRSETAVELIFEVSHEGPVANRLSCIVPEASIFNGAGVSVVGVGCVRLLAELVSSLSVKVHLPNYYKRPA
jgi:hypothetical protein